MLVTDRDWTEVAEGEIHKSDLVVRSLADGSESVVAQDNVSITRPIWSPDGASLAYTAGFKTINHDETPGYSGRKNAVHPVAAAEVDLDMIVRELPLPMIDFGPG